MYRGRYIFDNFDITWFNLIMLLSLVMVMNFKCFGNFLLCIIYIVKNTVSIAYSGVVYQIQIGVDLHRQNYSVRLYQLVGRICEFGVHFRIEA